MLGVFDDLSSHAFNSLTINNERVTKGSDEVFMTPFMKKVPDDTIFKAIEEILSNVELTPKLREIEDENRERFGPRSIAIPWSERKESLSDYFFDESTFQAEVDAPAGKLRPLSLPEAGKRLIASSSAGLPYMERKGKVLHEAIESQEEQAGTYPCVLYTRTQEGTKTRNVWGFPISDTLAEQRFATPFIQREKELDWRSALLGPDLVDVAITNLLRAKRVEEMVYCVDFRGFDSSVHPRHSLGAFRRICGWFQPRYHGEISQLCTRFVTIPVWTPDGEWQGVHGVPSGSTFTNTVDSLVQAAIADRIDDDGFSQGRPFQVQGDDGVYLVAADGLEQFTKLFEQEGFELNHDKTEKFETEEATYLQRYYHPMYHDGRGTYGGVYSLYRAAHRIKYLERWTDFAREGITGDDFFSLRTIMILENCKHHPGFEQFVRYAHTLDRRGLSYSGAGVRAYSRSLESRARAGVLAATNFQEGLSSFATVKVLAGL